MVPNKEMLRLALHVDNVAKQAAVCGSSGMVFLSFGESGKRLKCQKRSQLFRSKQ
jgi:hypothetical protein